MIIGITGGTGCGKTTLLKMIEAQGGLVLDCDAIYHELLKTDEDLLTSIEARFPGTVIGGSLQRKRLGEIVFTDSEALADLNTITHSAVRREVLCKLSAKPKLAAIDAIVLFGSGLAELCDVTVAVIAPTEDRVRRLMARDSIPEEYARKRIAAQPGNDWYRTNCDHVLENNNSIDAFAAKCLAFLESIGIMKP